MPNAWQRVWNREWNTQVPVPRTAVWTFVALAALVYPVSELLLKIGSPGLSFGLKEWKAMMDGLLDPQAPQLLKRNMFWLWPALAFGGVAFRAIIILLSYARLERSHGPQLVYRDFRVYFSSVLIATAIALAFYALLGALAWQMGMGFRAGFDVVETLGKSLEAWLQAHIPILIRLPYPLAVAMLFLGLNIQGLLGYGVHWLTHTSRVLWLTLHRPHHAPEIMHPLGTPLAFNFDFLLVIPNVLVLQAFSHLFYPGSLLLETTLVLILFYTFEIFNHATPFYRLAYHNPVIRFMSELSGNGIYHYMHHTAQPGQEMVNLGGGTLMLWDRLFGTFARPPKQAPPVGLSNLPELHMNPWRLTFSGFAQLGYELRANKDWRTRWKILFGGVEYNPPLSREFLIKGYPRNLRAEVGA